MSASTWKVVEQEAYVRLSEHRHRICRNLIAEFVLVKAKVYRLSMQPNVDCRVSGGRITGLCFVEYPHVLMKEVNSRGFMKRQLRNTRQIKTKDYSCILAGI